MFSNYVQFGISFKIQRLRKCTFLRQEKSDDTVFSCTATFRDPGGGDRIVMGSTAGARVTAVESQYLWSLQFN